MRKNILIAAVLLIALSLSGCDMINNALPNKNATVGDKVTENDNVAKNEGAMTVIEATATSLKVKMVNGTDSTWQSGNMRDYRLETERDGEWYEVKQIGELANTMELMLFAPNQELTHTFEFADRYGRLAPGKYRVVKSFWANATETAEAHELIVTCEFTVE